MLKVGAVLASAALAVAGCALTDQTADGIDSPREDALHDRVTQYTSAYLAGDGPAARKLLTTECQGQIDAATWDELASRIRTDYAGAEMVDYSARIWEGSRAEVSYDFGDVPLEKKNEQWVWDRDLGWLNAGC